MKPIIFQDSKGNVLKVKEINIVCNCRNNLWNKNRETQSYCSHVKLWIECLHGGVIDKFFKEL